MTASLREQCGCLGSVSKASDIVAGSNIIRTYLERIMPVIAVVGIEARNAAKKVSKGYEERAELRAAIANLTVDKTLQLTPVLAKECANSR